MTTAGLERLEPGLEADPLLDRGLMVSCLVLSSSEAVRAAAAAWLEAYDAARAAGAPLEVAEQRAATAWEVARRA